MRKFYLYQNIFTLWYFYCSKGLVVLPPLWYIKSVKGSTKQRSRRSERGRSLQPSVTCVLRCCSTEPTVLTLLQGVLCVSCLTVVGHVSVPFLEHEVDSMSSSPDLLHSLTVSHPWRAVAVYLHQLVGHLREQVERYAASHTHRAGPQVHIEIHKRQILWRRNST